MGPELNIFAIYTLEDIAVMHEITQRLKSSGEAANVSIWNDDPIKPGQVWKPQIESRLEEADVFLLCISNTFMHSEFVKQLEFKMVIDQYKAGTSKVIPILIDDCPWGIDFEADEYTFSFKELQVLPEEAKPLKNWASQEEAYKSIVAGIKSEIPSLSKETVEAESKTEEQTALRFNEEQEVDNRVEEENRQKEEAEALTGAAEEKKRLAEIEAKRISDEKRRQEEESKRQAEAQRLKEESEQKKKAEEESRLREQLEANRIAEEERQAKIELEHQHQVEEPKEGETNTKRKWLKLAAIAALAILGIWAFSRFNDNPEEKLQEDSPVTSEEIKDSVPAEKQEVAKAPSISKLAVGDFHAEGMVFAVDADSKNGVIVHLEDAGPMTWENAMKIHEQLGEGWRLPTLDELVILRKTVGQGADNHAEFSNGLYWTATDYDQHQARLLRMRDGNRSYHYNKVAEHRKYRVRAIRDFSQ